MKILCSRRDLWIALVRALSYDRAPDLTPGTQWEGRSTHAIRLLATRTAWGYHTWNWETRLEESPDPSKSCSFAIPGYPYYREWYQSDSFPPDIYLVPRINPRSGHTLYALAVGGEKATITDVRKAETIWTVDLDETTGDAEYLDVFSFCRRYTNVAMESVDDRVSRVVMIRWSTRTGVTRKWYAC
jgi:hypothetical protein